MMAVSAWGEDSAMAQADRAFVQAVAKADKAALEPLLDADFTWTDFEGKTATKSASRCGICRRWLSQMSSAAQRKEYSYGEIGDVQVNLGRAHVLRVWVKRAAGWKAIVYQEVMSLDAPPSFTPGAGKDCENPCKTVPYAPRNDTERQVIAAYSKLETAAMAHNSAVFTTMVGDEFVAASSNSHKALRQARAHGRFRPLADGGSGSYSAHVGTFVRFRGCGADEV